mmetsp:Transcript_34841/g.91534  ORF Transcript_34841/g.91534 Transcript_34841/m.91534 type:complete len:224 (-) Transcript_34841:198-869(-)
MIAAAVVRLMRADFPAKVLMSMINKAGAALQGLGYELDVDFVPWADSIRVTSDRVPIDLAMEIMSNASLEALREVRPNVREPLSVVNKQIDWTFEDNQRKMFHNRLKRMLSTPNFRIVDSGSCRSHGYSWITDYAMCQRAASALLGFKGTVAGENGRCQVNRPRGCGTWERTKYLHFNQRTEGRCEFGDTGQYYPIRSYCTFHSQCLCLDDGASPEDSYSYEY